MRQPTSGASGGGVAPGGAVTAVLALLLAVISPSRAEEQDAGLAKVLTSRGWVEMPREVAGVHYGGPTPAAAPGAPPGPAWYVTTPISANSRPRADEQQEADFVRSVEAAHAGKTRLIRGGMVLLVDPARRVWAVADHAPHLLRCYDGKGWTYRRADGRPAAADEAQAFARLAAGGGSPGPSTRRTAGAT